MNESVTMLLVHVGLCFMALAFGIISMRELVESKPKLGTELFLISGVIATVTGFFLPFETITPPVAVGIISTVLYVILLASRFAFHCKGIWRVGYALGIIGNVYFLAFVTVTQSFLKIPSLKAMAPTLKEAPFGVAQIIVILVFAYCGRLVLKNYRPS